MRRDTGVLAIALVLLTACQSIRISEVQDADTLFFGTNRAGGVVTEEEWRDFVDHVIVPVYPAFTEWQAIGHWRSERETTHVVLIVHSHRMSDDRDIERIIEEYKRRFTQESVFWMRGPAAVPVD
jgi:hypothetical protein